MRALDGLQGLMYVGIGCVLRRIALYGFDPPRVTEHGGYWGRKKNLNTKPPKKSKEDSDASSTMEMKI